MKLDIILTFNDIPTLKGGQDQKIGYKQKFYKKKPLSYYDQLRVLINSIKDNWHRYDYNIIALHSKPFDDDKKKDIERLGVTVLHRDESLFTTRHNNRVTAYQNDFCTGTHSLILDVDMIAFNELPEFREDVSVQVMCGKVNLMPKKNWVSCCEKYDIHNVDFTHWVDDPFKEYHVNDTVPFCGNMNNGAVLIKNEYKAEFRQNMIDIARDFLDQPECNAHVNWAAEQVAMSLAVLKSDDWCLLPKYFNFFSSEQDLIPNFNDISLYHYLGREANNKNLHSFDEYFKVLNMRILVISDHDELSEYVKQTIRPSSRHKVVTTTSHSFDLETCQEYMDSFDVIWSVHCKRLFPDWLTESKKCINIHPGFNPHNRGHAPHVFSLINGKPCGVTVHKIDSTIDNGKIIFQEIIGYSDDDTSWSVYSRIIELEKRLLRSHFDEWSEIQDGPYIETDTKGNINSRKDYKDLCKLDMDSTGTLREHVNLLRALTHDGYMNAYYLDKDGKKIYIEVDLTHEKYL